MLPESKGYDGRLVKRTPNENSRTQGNNEMRLQGGNERLGETLWLPFGLERRAGSEKGGVPVQR